MNLKLKEVFRGKVVNKPLTRNTGVDEFPRYVLEYLIDNYCSEETFHDLAMTSEITIMGKVLPVGGIQQKIQAAYDAGIKEALLPADNLPEAEGLPSYIRDAVKLTPVTAIDEVLRIALIPKTAVSSRAMARPRGQTSEL